MPAGEALAAELDRWPDLRRQLAEVREAAGQGVQQAAGLFHHAVGVAHAADLLAQWEGFGRFCRDALGLEPLTLLKALGPGQADPAAAVLAAYPDARADEAAAAGWAQDWARAWGRRFG